jgi:hypothetical protein
VDSLDSLTLDGWEPVWGASAYKPKDFYKFCFKGIETPDCLQKIWNSKCMMKHKVFAWLMLVDRLNTRNMLRRRNYDIASVYTCLLCDSEQDETRNHLFFGCAFSSSCWTELGILWNTDLHLDRMLTVGRDTWANSLYTECVILATWNIWKIRNRALFDGVQPEVEAWKRQVKQDLVILECRIKEEQKGCQANIITYLS